MFIQLFLPDLHTQFSAVCYRRSSLHTSSVQANAPLILQQSECYDLTVRVTLRQVQQGLKYLLLWQHLLVEEMTVRFG